MARDHRKGRAGAAPGDGRRHPRRQAGARGDATATSRRRSSGCASRGSPAPPSAGTASAPRARSRSSSPAAAGSAPIVALECETDFVAKSADFVSPRRHARRGARRPTARTALGAHAEEIDRLKVTLKENIALGRTVRFDAAEAVGARQLPARPERARRERRARRARGRQRRAGARHRGPHRLRPPRVPAARGRACRRRRRRADDHRGDRPQRGQARGAARQDRRGPPERVVQGARPARPAVRARREADDRAAARRCAGACASPRSSSVRDGHGA